MSKPKYNRLSKSAGVQQDEEEELEVEEDEQEVDPQCAFDDVSVPDESEAVKIVHKLSRLRVTFCLDIEF